MAILGNFGRALLFKKTGNFEILAKSLLQGDETASNLSLEFNREVMHNCLDFKVV